MSQQPEYMKLFGKPEPIPRPATNGAAQTFVGPDGSSAYGKAALISELATLANTKQGRRNEQLNISAFNSAQLVAAGHLPHDDTWVALRTTALSTGLEEKETDNTLASAFEAGMAQPRVVEDPPELEPPTVTEYDVSPQVGASLREEFPRVVWRDLWEKEDTEEWIISPLLPAGRIVALFSPAKTGKSLLMLEAAVAIARGTEVLGVTPSRARRVMYVDFENDPRGDVRTRLKDMGRGPEDLDDLVYLSFPALPKLDTAMGGLVLSTLAQEYEVEVVIIDTISRAVAGPENDNDTWLNFYRHTGVLLKAAGIACMRLDHTGKDTTRGMRGGSAKDSDVDVAWLMTAVSESRVELSCTLNRLPVPQRTLLLKREAEPHFHHEVETFGLEYMDPDVREWLLWLDEHGVEPDTGRPTIEKLCAAEGRKVLHARALEKAIKWRRDPKNRDATEVDEPLWWKKGDE